MKHALYLMSFISCISVAMDKPCAPGSPESRLLALRIEFLQKAGENSVDGMQQVEKEAMDSGLITDPDQKTEKLDYYAALAHAIYCKQGEAIAYLLNKKNLTFKNKPCDLLLHVCRGDWPCPWRNCGETHQRNFAQLMIKKGAPSSKADIDALIDLSESTNASERLITYLKEVRRSRSC